MSAATLDPQPPLDWLPEQFRTMVARDEAGQLWRIDWSMPGGRWIEVAEPFALASPGDQCG